MKQITLGMESEGREEYARKRPKKQKGQPAMFWIELRHSPGTKLRLKKLQFLDPTRYWVGYWTVEEGLQLDAYKVRLPGHKLKPR